MEWKINKNITEENINKVYNLIDKDLLISRICFTLNIDESKLFKYISEDVLKNIISSILINRNIDTKEKIDLYVNNIQNAITNPYDLINAELGADEIIKYMNNKNSVIYIYGDYDVDGIMSTYIMYHVINSLSKGSVQYYIPERSDGYGLSKSFCESIINNEKNNYENVLIITVDNGITKRQEVELLQQYNINVIITDHHESKENEVPNCIVIDPHNSSINQDDTFKHLCGAGVAFKVCQIIQDKFNIYNMMNYTPYLCLATLADVMPLTPENSAFIQYGLEIINSDNCPNSIKELMKQNKIDILTVNDILWTIAPMINACGRMGNMALANKCFFKNDNLKDTVSKIINNNETRKSITKKAQKELESLSFDNNNVCIYINENYPNGILGILAGKLSEKFNKPSIACSLLDDGLYHGSVRSCNNINMIDLFKDMKDKNIINDFGGHAESCSVTFDINNLDEINDYFNSHINLAINEEIDNISTPINIDNIINVNNLNNIVYIISNLLPCDNRQFQYPIFELDNIKLCSSKRFKSGYTELLLQQDNTIFEASIYGDLADKFQNDILPNLSNDNLISIIGSINKKAFFSSHFQKKSYTLDIVDII